MLDRVSIPQSPLSKFGREIIPQLGSLLPRFIILDYLESQSGPAVEISNFTLVLIALHEEVIDVLVHFLQFDENVRLVHIITFHHLLDHGQLLLDLFKRFILECFLSFDFSDELTKVPSSTELFDLGEFVNSFHVLIFLQKTDQDLLVLVNHIF